MPGVEFPPEPKCPECGSTDTRCIAVEPIFAPDDRQRLKPLGRIVFLKCKCGADFTEKVSEPPP
jgi:hypothetical protein